MTRRPALALWLLTSFTLLCTQACIFGSEEDEDVARQEALCQSYCNNAATTCKGDNQLFTSLSQCQSACLKYPITGRDGDTKGDSVQCRLYHLDAAKSDPTIHCKHASPDGFGVCTDNVAPTPCEQYCGQIQEACDSELTRQYSSQDDCKSKCPLFRENGTLGDRSGDTIQCRITQIVQPDEQQNLVQRCNNAGLQSEVCVD